MPFAKLKPKQPDPYIVKGYQQELAKFGHLDALVGYINTLENTFGALSGAPIKFNLTATTNPTPADNSSLGYSVNSIWYNTNTQVFWACTNAFLASWSDQVVGAPGVLNNMTANTAPTVNDDSGDGYAVNSGWFNTLSGLLYFAQDVTPGAAVWTVVPNSPAAVLTLNNCLFVAKNGNDTTGVVGDLSHPYLTIRAAYTAAVAGQTVVVYPGSYTETATIDLKNGVNMYFIGTGTIDTTAIRMFRDNGVAVQCRIDMGTWSFDSPAGRDFMYLTSATSDIYLCAKELDTNGAHFTINSTAVVTVDIEMMCADFAFTLVDIVNGGTFQGNFNTVNNPGGRCFWVENGGNLYINYNYGGTGSEFVKVDGANVTDVFIVNGKHTYGPSGWLIWFADSANCYFNGQYVNGDDDCILVATGATCVAHFNVQKVHNTYTGGSGGGTVHAESGATVYFTGTITRATNCTVPDLRTSVPGTPRLYLKGASYDPTRVQPDLAGSIKEWNGSSWSNIAVIQNNPAASGNTFVNSNVLGCTVNFANFTGCTLSGVDAKDQTITFSANSQTISPTPTWANLMTQLSAGALVQGMEYKISGAIDGSTIISGLTIKALSSTSLSPIGISSATISGDTRNCVVYFDFGEAADRRLYGYEDEKGNVIKTPYLATGESSGRTTLDLWLGSLASSTAGVTVDCATVGGTISIGSGSTICFGANVQGNGGAFVGYAGRYSNINVGDGAIGQTGSPGYSCRVGDNKVLDASGLTAYIATGKIYEGNVSTFVITPADSADVNPSALNNKIDMTTFPWAGILMPDDATNDLYDINAFPTDHDVTIVPNDTVFKVQGTTGLGLILLPAASLSLNPVTINGDQIVLGIDAVSGTSITCKSYNINA